MHATKGTHTKIILVTDFYHLNLSFQTMVMGFMLGMLKIVDLFLIQSLSHTICSDNTYYQPLGYTLNKN